MNLSQLIFKRLCEEQRLRELCGRYQGEPAVFNTEAPSDLQAGWEGKAQYPRIHFVCDLRADRERSAAGVLKLALYAEDTSMVLWELAEAVKRNFQNVLMLPCQGGPYGFAWARTAPPTLEGGIISGELVFDIKEYAANRTVDPDPAAALNLYMKRVFPEYLMIGLDQMPAITELSPERPAIYCRMAGAQKSQETNTVVWMDCKIAVHILCPDPAIRIQIAAALANRLALDGEVTLTDQSPMRILRAQEEHTADYLTAGLVTVTARYGLLRYREKKHSLTGGGIITKI